MDTSIDNTECENSLPNSEAKLLMLKLELLKSIDSHQWVLFLQLPCFIHHVLPQFQAGSVLPAY